MRSYSSTLDDMSPEIEQGLRNSIKQLKALKDFANFSFHVLDESVKSKIRSKFANHRLIIVQQTFEKMVIARTAKERQYALEASVFLFQLAQEFAVASGSQGTEKEGVTGGDDDTSSLEASKPQQ